MILTRLRAAEEANQPARLMVKAPPKQLAAMRCRRSRGLTSELQPLLSKLVVFPVTKRREEHLSQPFDEEEVRKIAYRLWEEDGYPFGRDSEYWERAIVIHRERRTAQTVEGPSETAHRTTAEGEAH